MIGAIYLATSGALLNQKRMEVITNNLANVNTAGFKKDEVSFRIKESPADVGENLMRVSLNSHRQTPPLWLEMAVTTNYASGPTKQTGSPFDFAISGRGFFSVQTPDGVRYTRDGRFSMDQDGQLVTSDGHPVLGDGGPIQVNGQSLIVDEDGNISVDGNAVDQFRIVTFKNADALRKIGNSLFAAAGANTTGESTEAVQVRQGVIEKSNVSTIRMMTEMIEVIRSYESYQKAIRSVDEATAKSINEVGRV